MKAKRSIGMLVLCALCTICLAAGVLVGCGGKKHSLVYIDGKAATCTEDGYSAYYMCTHCDKIFSDENGKNETTQADIKIAALGHDMHHHDADTATCTKPGNVEYWTCSREEGVYYADEAGTRTLESIGVTVAHNMTHHAQVDPTAEANGTVEYWSCSSCDLNYGDSWGDRILTDDELSIDKIAETIDGTLTGSFYHTENAFVVGAEDVQQGGMGMVVNAAQADDGLYFHIVANHNVSADAQKSGHGKVSIYLNFRNTENYAFIGDVFTALQQSILMELYLNGTVAYSDPSMILYYKTGKTAEGAKTAYSTVWEIYMPFDRLSSVNNHVFADVFGENSEGKPMMKAGYNAFATIIGNMDDSDKFTQNGESRCAAQGGEDPWSLWYKNNYGDWGISQLYAVITDEGFSTTVKNMTSEYNIIVGEYGHGTITLPASIKTNATLHGTVTTESGYEFKGLLINDMPYASSENNVYELAVDSLDVAWNASELTVVPVFVSTHKQSVTFHLSYRRAGVENVVPAGTVVTLSNGFDNSCSANVGENGTVTFNDIQCMDWTLGMDGYVDTTVSVEEGALPIDVTMEYDFATAHWTPKLTDLSQMNEANTAITINAYGYDGVNDPGDGSKNISAYLNLTENEISAKQYAFYVTVKVNDPHVNGQLQRFAINFVEQVGTSELPAKFVAEWGNLSLNLDPKAYFVPLLKNIPCGHYNGTPGPSWMATAVNAGMQFMIVRNNDLVSVNAYDYLSESWQTLGSVTIEANAKNWVEFFVSGENWTFSNMRFETFNEVELDLPEGEEDGMLAHLKVETEKGILFLLPNGAVVSEEDLVIPYNAIAYGSNQNVSVEDGTIAIAADEAAGWTGTAEVILRGNLKDAENVVFEMTVKMDGECTDAFGTGNFWNISANQRFAVTLTEGNAGFYFWPVMMGTSAETNVREFISDNLTDPSKEGDHVCQPSSAYAWMYTELTGEGLQMRFVRGQSTIILFAYDGTDWVELGSVACDADDATKIVLYAERIDWTFSDISVENMGELVAYKAPTPTATGNVAYYTDGENYWLPNGEETTLTEVTIAQLVERSVTLNVTFYGLDGEQITDANTLSEIYAAISGKIAVDGEYFDTANLTIANGNITISGIYEGNYTISVYGYYDDEFDVTEAEEINVELYQTIAYGSNDKVAVDDKEGTIVIAADGADGWTGTAEVVLPGSLKDAKNVTFEMTVKMDGECTDAWGAGNFWNISANQRFAVTLTEGNAGFYFWPVMMGTSAETNVREFISDNLTDPSKEGDHVCQPSSAYAWMYTELTGEGLQMRFVRGQSTIILFAYDGTEWVELGSVACDADDATKIVLYAKRIDWTFSDMNIEAFNPSSITVNTTSIEGVTLSVDSLVTAGELTGSIVSDTYSAFVLVVNGKDVASLKAGEFAINWAQLGLTADTTQITVSVKAMVKATSSVASTPKGNHNLDGETLDEKEILGYARYAGADTAAQHVYSTGDMIGKEMDAHGRYGNDYDGSTDGTTFTAGNVTNGSCAYFDPNQVYEITLTVSKDVSTIRIYTGTYQTNAALTYYLLENGVEVASVSGSNAQYGRTWYVDFNIDTSDWAEDETHTLTLRVGGATDTELAAIVLLGQDAE